MSQAIQNEINQLISIQKCPHIFINWIVSKIVVDFPHSINKIKNNITNDKKKINFDLNGKWSRTWYFTLCVVVAVVVGIEKLTSIESQTDNKKPVRSFNVEWKWFSINWNGMLIIVIFGMTQVLRYHFDISNRKQPHTMVSCCCCCLFCWLFLMWRANRNQTEPKKVDFLLH